MLLSTFFLQMGGSPDAAHSFHLVAQEKSLEIAVVTLYTDGRLIETCKNIKHLNSSVQSKANACTKASWKIGNVVWWTEHISPDKQK